ncbi:hypothetical protein GCM10020331_023020 [Ectobacillus funiculus]
MKVLRARVYDKFQQEAQAEYDQNRKQAVGTGDRSERIRTYNFPQNRVTDHRIGLTIQKLDQIIQGKLDDIINALIMEDQAQKNGVRTVMRVYEALKWASSFFAGERAR